MNILITVVFTITATTAFSASAILLMVTVYRVIIAACHREIAVDQSEELGITLQEYVCMPARALAVCVAVAGVSTYILIR
jgi:hypothetical protein